MKVHDMIKGKVYKINYPDGWAIWLYIGYGQGMYISSNGKDVSYSTGQICGLGDKGNWTELSKEDLLEIKAELL